MNKKMQTIVIVLILVIPAALILGINYFEKKKSNPTPVNEETSTTTAQEPTPSAAPAQAAAGSPKEIAAKKGYSVPADAVSAKKVTVRTDKGDIRLDLYPDVAPLAVLNFSTLGKRGYYQNVIFHRVLKSFVIQGGDPTGTGSGGESIYGKGFATETNPSYTFKPGTLGMARATDPNSNGTQFFIVTESNQPALDGSYTVFGKVADDASMTVVKAIAAVPVNDPQEGRPVTGLHITGFSIDE